ncbi:MAG: ketopantoate reductase family protein [Lachnospiraceae bacterium]|nr:ketopantoate reductase family protein [Lachnospiraceae bacterium]
MNVLIIGAGAVGIGVGVSLVYGGISVDFIARGETKSAIAANGISRRGSVKNIDISPQIVGCFDSCENLPENKYDFVVIATKTTANEDISSELAQNRKCMKESCKIIFMQNGIGYENSFLEYFDESYIYHSRVITGFVKSANNVSEVTIHQAPVLLGSIYGNDNSILAPLVDALDSSGLSAEISDNIEMDLWAKLIYNTTLNPLGAVLGMSYGELADSEYAHAIMDTMIEETFAIIKAIGANTYWKDADEYREELFNNLIPETYEHRSSTLQDIEKKKKTEIDTLTGSLLSLASENNVPAPVHSMIYWLVKALEEKF